MPFVGLFVGLCVGLTGVGGSSLTAPILLLFFGISPMTTVGTDLAYSVPTKLLGAFVHWRQGTTSWRAIGALCLGGFPGVLIGLAIFFFLTKHLDTHALDVLVRRLVGIALLTAAVVMAVTTFVKLNVKAAEVAVRPEDIVWSSALRVRLGAIGFLVGLAISLTSIGGGSLTLPLLYFAGTRLPIKQLIGSEVAFAALILPVAALGHLSLGHVNFVTCGLLLVGSIPGVYVGSRLASRVPEHFVRPAVAGVLALAGSRLF
jgi:uncharacterized membrane protein YfcA